MSSTSIHVTDLIPVVGTILSETQIPQGRNEKKIFVLHPEPAECRDCPCQNHIIDYSSHNRPVNCYYSLWSF